MHPEQQNYISKISTEFSEFFSNKKVLDVGSLNINGCIKDYTNNCDYTGIDVGPGNNVDVVCPGQDFNDPDESYDMVCSSECFEHNPFWVETFRNMIRLCKSKGFVFFTCATTGREEHGTKEAHSWCSPLTIELGWNYYKNLEEKDFREHFDFDKIFEKYQFEVNTSGSPDLYFWGIKKDIKNLKFSDVFDLHQGNSADKWEGYLKIYDEELSLVKNNCKKFLEIGINNGGSLEVFAKYFSESDSIVGIDIDQRCMEIDFNDSRIHAEIGDATEIKTKQMLEKKYGKFDIILDDGSHQSSDIIKSFFNLFDLLSPGGTYIIEDLCCSYWKEFEGGLKSKTSVMHFLKNLSDIINFEHWRSNFTIAEYLEEIGYSNIPQITLEKIFKIRSISFYNSICIIRTVSSSFENSIGKRFCRGNVFTLENIPINGQDIIDVGPSQNDNPYNIKIANN